MNRSAFVPIVDSKFGEAHFGSSRQNLDQSLDFFVSANHRIQFVGSCQSGQINRVGFQCFPRLPCIVEDVSNRLQSL